MNKVRSALDGMAGGLFATLIVGIILEQAGKSLAIDELVQFAKIAKVLMGPAIATGIAVKLNYKQLTTICAPLVGAIAAGSITATGVFVGDPFSCLVISSAVLFLLDKLESKNPLQTFYLPAIAIVTTGLIAMIFNPSFLELQKQLSSFINTQVQAQPLIGGAILSFVIGFAMSGPFSSAALAIIFGLSGQTAFVALAATSAQLMTFGLMSQQDNKFINTLLVFFGTSKIHLKNITRNYWIFGPPLIASVVSGVAAGFFSNLTTTKEAAGIGTCSLVAQIITYAQNSSNPTVLLQLVIFNFLIPLGVGAVAYNFFKRNKLIKKGDLPISS
ncbi:MAG: PTS sugar transporter subunit IIC [Mycoplasmatales bacterium]